MPFGALVNPECWHAAVRRRTQLDFLHTPPHGRVSACLVSLNPSDPRRLLVAALIFRLVAVFLIAASTPGEAIGALHNLRRATCCLFIFSVIELAKTLSCRALALRVHSHALFNALQARRALRLSYGSWRRSGRGACCPSHTFQQLQGGVVACASSLVVLCMAWWHAKFGREPRC